MEKVITTKKSKPNYKIKINDVLVNRKQKGNVLLNKNRFNYKFVDDIPEDYDVNGKVSVLFLQLQYHIKFPLYLKSRAVDL